MVIVVVVVFFASQSFIADSFCAIVTAFMMWATMLPLSIYSGQILLQVTKPSSRPNGDQFLYNSWSLFNYKEGKAMYYLNSK